MLTKVTVERALNAELDDHLGYEKHEPSANSNKRNGTSSKTLRTEDGQFQLDTPRDRDGSFEPKLVKKSQTRFTPMDDKILFLYAQGMTTREIVKTFKELYGADASPSLISKVTDAVIDQVVEWQSRQLDSATPLFISIVSCLKFAKTNRLLTNPFTWLWVSIWTATRSYWVCGYLKMKEPSFD